MSLLGWLVCTLAMLVLLVAAIGVIRLPDALARQHAATKAATLALTLFALGLALLQAEWAWSVRLLLLVGLLWLFMPLASHALARAAWSEARQTLPSQGQPPLKP